MGRREPDEREELLEARARLERQIELLRTPASLGPGRLPVDNSAMIVELSSVLREIDVRLSELG